MASKTIALLDYCFLFDPAETWQHLSQFEGAFGKFLKEHNMEGQVLNSINPRDGRRIIFIRSIKTPGVMDAITPAVQKPMATQDVIKKYTDPKTYQERK